MKEKEDEADEMALAFQAELMKLQREKSVEKKLLEEALKLVREGSEEEVKKGKVSWWVRVKMLVFRKKVELVEWWEKEVLGKMFAGIWWKGRELFEDPADMDCSDLLEMLERRAGRFHLSVVEMRRAFRGEKTERASEILEEVVNEILVPGARLALENWRGLNGLGRLSFSEIDIFFGEVEKEQKKFLRIVEDFGEWTRKARALVLQEKVEMGEKERKCIFLDSWKDFDGLMCDLGFFRQQWSLGISELMLLQENLKRWLLEKKTGKSWFLYSDLQLNDLLYFGQDVEILLDDVVVEFKKILKEIKEKMK